MKQTQKTNVTLTVLGVLILTSGVLSAFGQEQLFTTSGNFIIPVGVNKVTVEGVGGGGGGASTSGKRNSGGGGGGGAYDKVTIPVNPTTASTAAGGNVIVIKVGGGGGAGQAGDTSTARYGGLLYLKAMGGAGGTVPNGGSGGAKNNESGHTSYKGGNGAGGYGNGNTSGSGGGGGGGAGPSSDGGNGQSEGLHKVAGGLGKWSINGQTGNGGGGSETAGNGNGGSPYGGGGGGSRRATGDSHTGGSGAVGIVRVTYTVQHKNVVFHSNYTDANHSTESTYTQDFVVNQSQSLTANTFTRYAYRFVGWSTTANGSVNYVDQATYTHTSFDNDSHLYAVWEIALNIRGDHYVREASNTDTMMLNVLANDVYPIDVYPNVTVVTQPAHGSAWVDGTTVKYNPIDTLAVQQSFTYMVTCIKNSDTVSDTATVLISTNSLYDRVVTEHAFKSSKDTVVPYGVHNITVHAIGGGGGGGGAHGTTVHCGGGGGGGYACVNNYQVTPHSPISITVGSGGAAGRKQASGVTNGGDGGTSSVTYNGQTFVSANGGKGAESKDGAGLISAGGAGGTASGIAGTVCRTGGSGAAGSKGDSNYSGGGGGAAGTNGNGGNASANNGGAGNGTYSGNGGSGASGNGSDGGGGFEYGGGGAGGYQKTVSSDGRSGGSGAQGIVWFSYRQHRYKVVYHANNHTDASFNQIFTCNETVQLTANPWTERGCNFLGWSRAADSTNVAFTDNQSIMVSDTNINEIHLYAVWQPYVLLHNDTYVREASDLRPIVMPVLVNDTFPETRMFSHNITYTQPDLSHGTFSWNSITEQFTYTPNDTFAYQRQFTYTVSCVNNSDTVSATATVFISTNSLWDRVVTAHAFKSSKDTVVPYGVHNITMHAIGGGGGGGGVRGTTVHGGGGGGGGYARIENYPVVPTTPISIEVGSGGDAGRANEDVEKNGASGGQSSVSYEGLTLITANGGKGGVSVRNNMIDFTSAGTAGGDGGDASGINGTILHTGGSGASGSAGDSNYSGGGGGAAGVDGDGGNASEASGGNGNGLNSGNGGDGAYGEGETGSDGKKYGGGGSGGYQKTFLIGGRAGGYGGQGIVWFSYRQHCYGVVLHANFTPWETKTQIIPCGENKPLDGVSFSRWGYRFAGWSTTPTGPVRYANGANFFCADTNINEFNLYAKWNPYVHTESERYARATGSTDTMELDVFANDEFPLDSVSVVTYTALTDPSAGTLIYDSNSRKFMFIPDSSFVADVSFNYTVNCVSLSSTSTVTISTMGLKLNCADSLDTDHRVYYYPNAEFQGYARTISVLFAEDPTGCEITLETLPSGWETETNDSHTYYLLRAPINATTAEIQSVIRGVRFHVPQEGALKQIAFMVNGKDVESNVYYYAGNDHYYKFVPLTSGTNVRSWTQAYEAARNDVFCGRQGYLATVTSKDEDLFLTRIACNSRLFKKLCHKSN